MCDAILLTPSHPSPIEERDSNIYWRITGECVEPSGFVDHCWVRRCKNVPITRVGVKFKLCLNCAKLLGYCTRYKSIDSWARYASVKGPSFGRWWVEHPGNKEFTSHFGHVELPRLNIDPEPDRNSSSPKDLCVVESYNIHEIDVSGATQVFENFLDNLNKPDLLRKRLTAGSHRLSLEDKSKLYNLAGGRCQICGIPLSKSKDKLWRKGRFCVIDHDHESGKIRGILCHNCNIMLGCSQDSIDLLERGQEYLRRRVI